MWKRIALIVSLLLVGVVAGLFGERLHQRHRQSTAAAGHGTSLEIMTASIQLPLTTTDRAPATPDDAALDVATDRPPTSPTAAPADNLILLIGDGMGLSHVLGARLALTGRGGRLTMEQLAVASRVTTFASDQLYTDSAASATALATGQKTLERHVSVSPTGEPLLTVIEAAVAASKSAGVITDSYLWDATPAAFTAHASHRRNRLEIADSMAAAGATLLIGSEVEGLLGDDGDAGGRLLDAFHRHGYRIVRSLPELLRSAVNASIVALFPPGQIADAEQAPSLSELTAFAIERLSSDPEGFVLVVETEETDTASHRWQFDRMVAGVQALDQALRVALDFARSNERTLIVVTADHETGGLLLVDGKAGEPLEISWTTDKHTASQVPLFAHGPGADALAGLPDNTDVGRAMARALGLELGAASEEVEASAPVDGPARSG